MFSINVDKKSPGLVVCQLVGTLDAKGADGISPALGSSGPILRLLIDLSSIAVVHSTGVNGLATTIHRARESGAEVTVACDRPSLVRLLRSTGLDKDIRIVGPEDDGTAGVSEPRTPVEPSSSGNAVLPLPEEL